MHAVGARSSRQAALVADHQCQPGDEERRLPRPSGQLLEVELRARLEDLVVRPEPDPRPGHASLRPADDRERALALVCGEGRVGALHAPAVAVGARLAAPEAHAVGLAGPVDLDVQPGGQRVDDGGADAVETTRRRIRGAAELAARVQLGEDDLDAGQAGARLGVDRDAAALVEDLDGAVGVQDHLDAVPRAGQGLVDRVVDDLPEAVHEALAVARADIHAGALADRLEPLQDLQVAGGVVPVRARSCCSAGHSRPSNSGVHGGEAPVGRLSPGDDRLG